jgi:hypothetical protein
MGLEKCKNWCETRVRKLEPLKAKEKRHPKRTIDLRDFGEEYMFLVKKKSDKI